MATMEAATLERGPFASPRGLARELPITPAHGQLTVVPSALSATPARYFHLEPAPPPSGVEPSQPADGARARPIPDQQLPADKPGPELRTGGVR